MPLFVANRDCAQLPEERGGPQERSSHGPTAGMARASQISLADGRACVTLLPDVNGCSLYSVRGERVWSYRRTAPGLLRVVIPRAAHAGGISCIKYSTD
jgi:hypothetical protein